MFQTTNQIKYTNPTNSSSHFYRRSWLLAISAAFGASGGFTLQSSSGSSKAKSRPASCDRRKCGFYGHLGNASRFFARLAGRLNRVVNFTVNSNAIRICMHMCHMSAVIIEKNIKQILWKCPDFDRSHEATPTIQLLTITYVRTLPAAQNTEKKTIPDLEGKNWWKHWWSNPPVFEWSNHVKTCRCPENDVKSCDIRIWPCLQPLIHWGIVQDKHQVPLPGGAAGNQSSGDPVSGISASILGG